jgi:uncharacterized protein
LWTGLVRGGFVIPPGFDELVAIREVYAKARSDTPIVLTVTTTMDCNLGCYYCYESRSKHQLLARDVPQVVSIAQSRLEKSGKRALHVDWYGGEPMMNLNFLVQASSALQELCRNLHVDYVASIISNGTCWPEDVVSFVRAHKLRQAQISFDGMRDNHNKRRYFNREHVTDAVQTPFDLAVNLVDRLVQCTNVDLRFNIDRKNAVDLEPLITFARTRGWFNAPFRLKFQPARLASFSERSSFMRGYELSVDEYDLHRCRARELIAGETPIEESEAPYGFPFPRSSVCAALAQDSIVLGAEGVSYRCGLQVGEWDRSVGNFRGKLRYQPKQKAESKWWNEFDPTRNENCSQCSFLPICWGGCPKKHLEGDTHTISEQGEYWRKNLSRLIATGVSEHADDKEYDINDQFRTGHPQHQQTEKTLKLEPL